jgi:hypothetical protein
MWDDHTIYAQNEMKGGIDTNSINHAALQNQTLVLDI